MPGGAISFWSGSVAYKETVGANYINSHRSLVGRGRVDRGGKVKMTFDFENGI
jgi:hypothetical protein